MAHSYFLLLLSCAGILIACSVNVSAAPGKNSSGVKVIESSNSVRVEINGALFTEYHFGKLQKPFFYPVLGPGELPMTRNWPMNHPPDEEHDHPHHKSLWYAHGAVNGIDFWSEEPGHGTIVHDGFTELASGETSGVIHSRDKWVAPDGRIVCTDDRTFRVYHRAEGKMFDFEVTLHASNGDVTFGDTKEGTMAMRLAETMRLKGAVGHGHIVNSEGVHDDLTWGKRADWVDYHGPVNGRIVGVAIFDHPANPRHPTTWHVRDYGLFAANPFGLHAFENKPPGAGNFTIRAGESVTFRYRFYLHEGDEEQAKVAEAYAEYAATKPTKH